MTAISLVRILTLGLLLCPLGGCNFLRGYAEGKSAAMTEFSVGSMSDTATGAARFVFDDFGGLNTDTLESNALPWKLATTALLLTDSPGVPITPDTLRRVLREFGFIYPSTILNWPHPQQPKFEKPLGMVSGIIGRGIPKIRLEVSNLGCASCHAGVTYEANGHPTTKVWLGLPNTSLNLDAFVVAVYQAIKRLKSDPEKLLYAITQLYPDTTVEELDTIRKFVWPRLTKRVAELEASGDEPLPFSNGGAGNTNGVAALKLQFHLLSANMAASGSTSIPDLGYRNLRSSLLCDGAYTNKGSPRFISVEATSPNTPDRLAHIVAFFTVPTMGMQPDRASHAIPQVEDVLKFMNTYTPPLFPGPVDRPRAARGRTIYDTNCARCHGSYSRDADRPRLVTFPNRLVAQAEIGTDPTRWQAIDSNLLQAISRSELAKHIDAMNSGGYVAPILSGLWATAPYFHNGSIPTLWHIMHPEARPKRFWVGGHALDFTKLGIAGNLDLQAIWVYPSSYQPWSKPVLFDTSARGHDNHGHEKEFSTLSEDEKEALLEFLKLL